MEVLKAEDIIYEHIITLQKGLMKPNIDVDEISNRFYAFASQITLLMDIRSVLNYSNDTNMHNEIKQIVKAYNHQTKEFEDIEKITQEYTGFVTEFSQHKVTILSYQNIESQLNPFMGTDKLSKIIPCIEKIDNVTLEIKEHTVGDLYISPVKYIQSIDDKGKKESKKVEIFASLIGAPKMVWHDIPGNLLLTKISPYYTGSWNRKSKNAKEYIATIEPNTEYAFIRDNKGDIVWSFGFGFMN